MMKTEPGNDRGDFLLQQKNIIPELLHVKKEPPDDSMPILNTDTGTSSSKVFIKQEYEDINKHHHYTDLQDDRFTISIKQEPFEEVPVEFDIEIVNSATKPQNQQVKTEPLENQAELFTAAPKAVAKHKRVAVRPRNQQQTDPSEFKKYQCDICKKFFKSIRTVRAHMQFHSPNLPYNCTMCGYKTIKQIWFDEHMKIHSNVEKPFKCNLCDYDTIHKNCLKTHMKKRHSRLPRVVHCCSVCGFKTYRKQVLKYHNMVSHTVNNAYECSDCGFRSTKKHNLVPHLKLHAGEKKLLECSVCKAQFGVAQSLTKHMKLHDEPYACSVCAKRFREETAWIVHARVHDGEKPYECLECKIRFRIRASFESHMMLHQSEIAKSVMNQHDSTSAFRQRLVPLRTYKPKHRTVVKKEIDVQPVKEEDRVRSVTKEADVHALNMGDRVHVVKVDIQLDEVVIKKEAGE